MQSSRNGFSAWLHWTWTNVTMYILYLWKWRITVVVPATILSSSFSRVLCQVASRLHSVHGGRYTLGIGTIHRTPCHFLKDYKAFCDWARWRSWHRLSTSSKQRTPYIEKCKMFREWQSYWASDPLCTPLCTKTGNVLLSRPPGGNKWTPPPPQKKLQSPYLSIDKLQYIAILCLGLIPL